MHKIIQSIWRGEYNPGEQHFQDNSRYAAVAERQCSLLQQFLATLTEEQRKIYDQITDMDNELTGIIEEEIFITGYQFGAKIILGAIADYSGQFHV